MNSNLETKTILITGASGMIGECVVKQALFAGYKVIGIDLSSSHSQNLKGNYAHYSVDLSNKMALKQIICENSVDRIIHLAALAHSRDGVKNTWEDYRKANVECSKNVFSVAGDIPVLFISTVDVYGFAKCIVNSDTKPDPVSHYAKSKALAEIECQRLPSYTIFRLSPVYTETVKRDIRKRYYLSYPVCAYVIGKGVECEVVDVQRVATRIVEWCKENASNNICIVKDEVKINTRECVERERSEGRAKIVLHFPRWFMVAIYEMLKFMFGKNKYVYLLHKAVYPLKSE